MKKLLFLLFIGSIHLSFGQYIPTAITDPGNGYLGMALDPVGDVNADGKPDYVAGAWLEDALGANAGRAYIISGADQTILRTLNSPSPVPEGWFGYAVASGYDLNSDGIQDIVVGAPGETGGATGSGKVHVFSGSDGNLLFTLISPAPVTNGQFGNAVLIQNDTDASGTREIIVGAYQEPGSATTASGRVHVFNGNTFRNTIVSPNAEEFGGFGWRLASADNFLSKPALIVSAVFENPASSPPNSGVAYAFDMTNVSSPLLTTVQADAPKIFGNFGWSISAYTDPSDGATDLLLRDINGTIVGINSDGTQLFETTSGGTSITTGNFNKNSVPDFATVSQLLYDELGYRSPIALVSGGYGYFAYENGLGDAIMTLGDTDNDGAQEIVTFAVGQNSTNTLNQVNSGLAGLPDGFARVDLSTGTLAPTSVTIGDLDGDGNAEIAATNFGSMISVYRNTSLGGGNITYEPKLDFPAGTNALSAAIRDLDGDGKADIAVANSADNTVSILPNTSPGIGVISFAPKVDFATGPYPQSVAIGDFDGDAKPDLAVANGSGTSVSVLRNTTPAPGTITLAARVDFMTGTTPYSVKVADLDGDGKLDIVVANGGNTISLFRNTSAGPGLISFDTGIEIVAGTTPISVSVGDLDGDTKVDLAVANQGNATVSVFLNTSSGPGAISYAPQVDFATGQSPYAVAIGALDADNKPDLVVANQNSGSISVFRNTTVASGIIAYSPKEDYGVGFYPRSVGIGDLDGNGIADLAIANTNSNSLTVFRNLATNPVALADSLALVDLYNSTNGAAWTNKTNWLTGPASSWFGVTVRQNRVAKLQMYGNNITGPLPSAIGNLTDLDSLILAGNKLSGTLPAELGNLTQVLFIDLGGNQFTGSLPASLFTLTQLKTFGFAGNQLSGTIPPAVGNLVNLESFWIDRNNFSGAIPSEINNLANVKNFYLQDNQFTFVPPLALPALLGGSIQNNFLEFNSIIPNVAVSGLQYNPQKKLPSAGPFNVLPGQGATFTKTVGGAGNVYQWKKGTTNISGATTDTYSIASATVSDNAGYNLTITNPGVPGLTLVTEDFLLTITSASAFEESGYQLYKILGAQAQGVVQVSTGRDVAYDSNGNLLILDSQDQIIKKFDAGGNLIGTIGGPGINDGRFTIAMSMAITPGDSIYVVDFSLNRVQLFNSSGQFITRWGSTGSGDGQFRGPRGIAVDPVTGNVYVADSNNNRIQVFNSTGTFLTKFGTPGTGPGQFNGPYKILVTPAGQLLVSDRNNHRIQIFTTAGVFTQEFGANGTADGQFNGPIEMAVAANGDILVVDQGNNRVQRFNSAGTPISKFGVAGINPGEFRGLESITLAANGDIIVGDINNGVQRFSNSGTFLSGIANVGNGPGLLRSVVGIATDSKGNRYFAESNGARIQKVDSDGNYLLTFGTYGAGNGQFTGVTSVAIDRNDNVYVADNAQNRIQKFNSAGTFLLSFGTPGTGDGQFSFPNAMAFDKANTLWIIDSGNKRVQQFTTNGVFISKFGTAGTGAGQLNAPAGIAIDPAGDIYISETNPNRIQKFKTDGSYLYGISTSNGNAPGQLNSIFGMSFDFLGKLYVSDRTNNRIQKFDNDFSYLTRFGETGTGNGDLFNGPNFVHSNTAGDTLWISEFANRVQIWAARSKQANATDSLALVSLYNSMGGPTWTNKTNWLTGSLSAWHGVAVSAGRVRGLNLQSNNLQGAIPPSIADLSQLIQLDLSNNQITTVPPEMATLLNLQQVNLNGNLLTGTFPSGLSSLTNIRRLKVAGNSLTGPLALPVSLNVLHLQNNQFEDLPDLTGFPLDSIRLQNNRFQFDDLETAASFPSVTYAPQDSVGVTEDKIRQVDSLATFGEAIAGTSVLYQWKKDNVVIPAATTDSFTIPSVQFSDEGIYRLEATSPLVPGLTLTSRNKRLRVSSLVRDSIALRTLYDSTAGAGWVLDSNWLSDPIGSGTWYGVTVLNNRVTSVDLSDNNLVGKVPVQFTNLKDVITVDLSGNKLTGLPDITTLPLVTSFKLENNQLDFGDLELNAGTTGISYAPQDSVSSFESVLKQIASSQTFTSAIAGTANQYQWKKDGTNLAGATSKDLTISNITFNEDGIYTFEATNPLVPGLTLLSAKKQLRVSSLERDELALTKFFNDTGGPNWTRKDDWVVTPLATGNWFGVTITNNRVTNVSLPNNNIKGALTASIADVENLVTLDLSNNLIEQMPNLTTLPNIVSFDISGNKLDFGSLIANTVITGIDYSDQADLGEPRSDSVSYATDFKVKVITRGEGNRYQWKRNGVNVTNATDSTYVIPAINRSNMGDYLVEITNPAVPNLVLKSSNWRVLATATLSGLLRETATDPVTVGKVTLFKINTTGKYDTTKIQKVNTSGEFKLEKVVLDDYLLLAEADTITYRTDLPTWYKGTLYWEEADTLFVNEDQTDLNILIQKKPTTQPKGQGVIAGVFEDTNVQDGGRTQANKRIPNAGVSIRRKTNTGRPQDDTPILVAYTFTDDQGAFRFEDLEQGDYLLNLQYPGYPMDPNSFINIQIGTGLAKSVEVKAVVEDGKIKVEKIIVTGWDEEDNRFRVYPVPAATEFTLQVNEYLEGLSYRITNTMGQEVLTGSMPSRGLQRVDAASLAPGVYHVQIQQSGVVIKTFRILIR